MTCSALSVGPEPCPFPFPLVHHAASESATVLLSRVCDGDRSAFDRLMPLVYQELHRMARRHLGREGREHTLQPTALLHEAYLRLVDYRGADYKSRAHFFAIATRVMRQVLVDHARARLASKRDANSTIALEPNLNLAPDQNRVVIALHDALNTLAREDERKARLVEMRFFGGMTAEEIAACTEMSVHVVRHELRLAQIRLRQVMEA